MLDGSQNLVRADGKVWPWKHEPFVDTEPRPPIHPGEFKVLPLMQSHAASVQCPQCSSPTAHSAAFCEKCGARLNRAPASPGYKGASERDIKSLSKMRRTSMTSEEAYHALDRAIQQHNGVIFGADPPRGGLVRIDNAPWVGPPLVGRMRVEAAAQGQSSIGIELASDWSGGGKFIALALTLLLAGPVLSMVVAGQPAILPIALSVLCAGGLVLLSLYHPRTTEEKILDGAVGRKAGIGSARTESPAPASAAGATVSPSGVAAASQPKPAPSARHESAEPRNPSEQATIIQQIKMLSELRTAGVISDDEFNAKKTALLAKL
jgi:hypothetical protein